MSELVAAYILAERPATIYIGIQSRFAKRAGHVWRYRFTWVGSERFYVCMGPPSISGVEKSRVANSRAGSRVQ